MTAARQGAIATLLLSGRVLVAGGTDEYGRRLTSAELYDPETNRWSPTARMSTPRESESATASLLLSGKVLVAGSSGTYPDSGSAELYSP